MLWFSSYVIVFEFSWKVKEKKKIGGITYWLTLVYVLPSGVRISKGFNTVDTFNAVSSRAILLSSTAGVWIYASLLEWTIQWSQWFNWHVTDCMDQMTALVASACVCHKSYWPHVLILFNLTFILGRISRFWEKIAEKPSSLFGLYILPVSTSCKFS